MKPVPLHHVWRYTDVDRAFWREHLEDWLPQRIFDAHTHVNEAEFRVVAMTEEKRRQYWVNEVAEPIGAAAADRCHRLVLPGRDLTCLCFGYPSLEFDIDRSNARLQRDCQSRDWYCLSVARPEWPAQRIADELDRPKVIGVKVYYELIGYDPSTRDKHLEAGIFEFLPHRQLEVLERRRAWLTLHVPKADRLGHPQNIAEVREIRRRYPNIVVVVAHLGRCYTLPQAEEALPLLAGDEGLYFDTSAVFNPQVLEFALRTLGAKRILYGTDNPILYMRCRQQWQGRKYVYRTSYPFHFNKDREPPEVEAKYTLGMYEALRALKDACSACRLARADLEAIFHDNARRLVDGVLGQKAPTKERSASRFTTPRRPSPPARS